MMIIRMLMQIMQLLICLKLNKKYQVKQAKIATTTKKKLKEWYH